MACNVQGTLKPTLCCLRSHLGLVGGGGGVGGGCSGDEYGGGMGGGSCGGVGEGGSLRVVHHWVGCALGAKSHPSQNAYIRTEMQTILIATRSIITSPERQRHLYWRRRCLRDQWWRWTHQHNGRWRGPLWWRAW